MTNVPNRARLDARTALLVSTGALCLAAVPLSLLFASVEVSSAFEGPGIGYLGSTGTGFIVFMFVVPIAGLIATGVALFKLKGLWPRAAVLPLALGCFLLARSTNVPGHVMAWSWTVQCEEGAAAACRAASDFYRCGEPCNNEADIPHADALERRGDELAARSGEGDRP